MAKGGDRAGPRPPQETPPPWSLMLQPELLSDSHTKYEGAGWVFPREFKAQMQESGMKWT